MITIAHLRLLYYWPVIKFKPSSVLIWKSYTNLATYPMKIYCQNGKSNSAEIFSPDFSNFFDLFRGLKFGAF